MIFYSKYCDKPELVSTEDKAIYELALNKNIDKEPGFANLSPKDFVDKVRDGFCSVYPGRVFKKQFEMLDRNSSKFTLVRLWEGLVPIAF